MLALNKAMDTVIGEIAGEQMTTASDMVYNYTGKTVTHIDDTYDEFAEDAEASFENRQGRIKSGTEFILGTVLGIERSKGKGNGDNVTVGVKEQEGSGVKDVAGGGNRIKNIERGDNLAATNQSTIQIDKTEKPKYTPDLKKWEAMGGSVKKNEDGTVTDKDWEGNEVTYHGDTADFKSGGHVVSEVEIENMEGDHYNDYKKANQAAGYGDGPYDNPKDTTWHHKDCKVMQCVDENIHNRFTHKGAVSDLKKKAKEKSAERKAPKNKK